MVFNKFCCLRNFEAKGILDMKEPLKHSFKMSISLPLHPLH